MEVPSSQADIPAEKHRDKESEIRGLSFRAGDEHYRAYVGPPEFYDTIALLYIRVLAALGLRETHTALDIGCGSLRGGKLLIPFLLPDRYCGIEPNAGLIDEGIARELGEDIRRVKRPRFSTSHDYEFKAFGTEFDYLIAQSIFSHAPASQIRRCLSNAARVMHERSLFVFTYWPGEVDHGGEEWVYPGTTPYTRTFFDRAAEGTGLVLKDLPFPHPAGQRWIVAGSSGVTEEAVALAHREVEK